MFPNLSRHWMEICCQIHAPAALNKETELQFLSALDGDLLSDSRSSRFKQGNRASVTLSRHWMEICCQIHAPAALTKETELQFLSALDGDCCQIHAAAALTKKTELQLLSRH